MRVLLPDLFSTLRVASAAGDRVEQPVGLGGQGLAVDVHPLGLDLEPRTARTHLAEWKGESAQTLQREGRLRAALLREAE